MKLFTAVSVPLVLLFVNMKLSFILLTELLIWTQALVSASVHTFIICIIFPRPSTPGFLKKEEVHKLFPFVELRIHYNQKVTSQTFPNCYEIIEARTAFRILLESWKLRPKFGANTFW